MDLLEFKRKTLQHCLWMAGRDPAYAQWAAEQYEKTSSGLLPGLADKVRGAIKKHAARTSAVPEVSGAAPPTAPTGSST